MRGEKSIRKDGLFHAERETDPFRFEREAHGLGYHCVAGIDEAGRGPLAGPVVAAAVILPKDCQIPKLTDSKLLTPQERDRLFLEIHEHALSVGVGISDVGTIESINILEATRLAMERAVCELDPAPDFLLIDALTIRSSVPQRGIVKGDLRSHSIAAGSVIAKVMRDRIMEEYHLAYPVYNFRQNKGYGTQEHRMKIRTLGPTPIHRKTFRGVREYVTKSSLDEAPSFL